MPPEYFYNLLLRNDLHRSSNACGENGQQRFGFEKGFLLDEAIQFRGYLLTHLTVIDVSWSQSLPN
jgi:hypothetical protein